MPRQSDEQSKSQGCPFPIASGEVGLTVLKALARERSLLAALETMHTEVGPAFQITLPGFQPAVLVGPESTRQILVKESASFNSRSESDPVTKLLRHGVLVVDGEQHATLRAQMEPALHKQQVIRHIPAMQAYTDRVIDTWKDSSEYDMLVEMRRVALLVFMGTLFRVDFAPDMERLWQPILQTLKYISPGLWIVWPSMPRPGYQRALDQMDDYLYGMIRERRNEMASDTHHQTSDHAYDLLSTLVQIPELNDDIIRDQLLTMLIAGHDTSTALLAWALHLLGQHPTMMARIQAEVDNVIGRYDQNNNHNTEAITIEQLNQLNYLDMFLKETLRLYPPIHVGNRIVAEDTDVVGYELNAGTRAMVSIYLSHRDERHWAEPHEFRPERFAAGQKRPSAFTYIPFGAGPRTCIGATYAQIEAKVILARILQKFSVVDVGRQVRRHMGATLEPHPGVFMRVERR